MDKQPIQKFVILDGGLGTRMGEAMFATKSKGLYPLQGTPIILHAIAEVLEYEAKIQKTNPDFKAEIAIVHGPHNKEVLENFFNSDQIIQMLEAKGNKQALVDQGNRLKEIAQQITYCLQPEPLGMGHSVLMAEDFIAGQAFVVSAPDDYYTENPLLEMIELSYNNSGSNVIAAMTADTDEEKSRYGMMIGDAVDERTVSMTGMIEKPKSADDLAKVSNKAAAARYVLQPSVIEAQKALVSDGAKGAGNEYQLTNAIEKSIENGTHTYGFVPPGDRLDAGTAAGIDLTTTMLTLQNASAEELLEIFVFLGKAKVEQIANAAASFIKNAVTALKKAS